jgi:hypothetical protein
MAAPCALLQRQYRSVFRQKEAIPRSERQKLDTPIRLPLVGLKAQGQLPVGNRGLSGSHIPHTRLPRLIANWPTMGDKSGQEAGHEY